MSTTLGKRVRDENAVEGVATKKQRITPTLIPFAPVDLNAQVVPSMFNKKPVDITMKDVDGKENREHVEDDIEEEDEVVGLYEDDPNAPLVDEEADDFGLQSEETNFEVNDGSEPQEALQLAHELGLTSADEALSKMGNSEKKTAGVISAYSALIDQDQQTKSVYDELTKEIEETENKVRAGIESIFQHHAAGSEVKLTKDSVDYLRNVFEKYIKVIADAALVHAQHRQRGVVLLHNILEAFKLLGVTMYWPSEVDMPEEDEEDEDEEHVGDEADADADEENDAEDADESESEDEEDALNKTNDEAENEEEVKESRFKIDSVAFRRIADAVVEPQEEEEDDNADEEEGDEGDEDEDESEWAIQESALDAMQASAEEFTSQLVESALKMAQLYERKEISPADLKFVLTLWQNTPGGSDIMKRIRI